MLFEIRFQKPIDRVDEFIRLGGLRNWRTTRGKRRLPRKFSEGETLFPGEVFVDPALQCLDLLGSQTLSFGGHAKRGIGRGDPLNEITLVAFFRSDHGAAVSSGQERVPRVKREASFFLRPRMALGAFLLKNRSDIVCEINRFVFFRGRFLGLSPNKIDVRPAPNGDEYQDEDACCGY